MKNLHTLKLTASSIGSAVPRTSEPAPVVEVEAAPTQEIPRVVVAQQPARKPRAAATRKQLLTLLTVELAATLAAVAATGSIHSTIFRIAAFAIAITVALAVAIESLASARRRVPAAAPAGPVATARPAKTLTKSKIALLLVMAVGFASYFGGGGAFGTFTAEDSNPNSNIASGTLTMSNTVNNRTTACFSYNGSAANNVNPNCDVAFSLAGTGDPNSAPGSGANPTGAGNLGPGAYGGVAKITIQNAGSLNAGTFTLVAPYVNATLHTNAIPTGTFSQITINNLEGTITSGDRLIISYGSQSLTVKASSTYSPTSPITNDITVNVTAYPSGTANNSTGATIPVGATVVDEDSDVVSNVLSTDCYDQKATTNQVSGATVGNTLTFNTGATTNSLCNTALLYVQEVGTNSNYCWFGVLDGATNLAANGMCAAPISANPTAFVGNTNSFSPSTTYTVAPLKGNVRAGDSLTMAQGNNAVTCVASQNQFMGDTSISTNATACTVVGSNGAFSSSAVITDTTTLGLLNPGPPSLAADTIASFDTSKSGTNGIPLYPVSSNGVNVPGAPVSLGAYGSSNSTRTFYVGVYLPSANGTNQNTIQGLMSTFGMTWHLGS